MIIDVNVLNNYFINAILIKKNKNNFSNLIKMLSQDILKHIASEFLYFTDALNLKCCCKHFNIKPHQLNFGCNRPFQIYCVTGKNVDMNLLQKRCEKYNETYSFDVFVICCSQKKLKVFKKFKIKELKTCKDFNEKLEEYFDVEKMQSNKI